MEENQYAPITEDMDPNDLVFFIPDDEEDKGDYFVIKVFIAICAVLLALIAGLMLIFTRPKQELEPVYDNINTIANQPCESLQTDETKTDELSPVFLIIF